MLHIERGGQETANISGNLTDGYRHPNTDHTANISGNETDGFRHPYTDHTANISGNETDGYRHSNTDHTANIQNDVFAQQAVTVDATNKAFRHAAYRQYVLWVYRRLQRDNRRTVPACCVNVIRNKFPSADGHYTGFIPARHGVGW